MLGVSSLRPNGILEKAISFEAAFHVLRLDGTGQAEARCRASEREQRTSPPTQQELRSDGTSHCRETVIQGRLQRKGRIASGARSRARKGPPRFGKAENWTAK